MIGYQDKINQILRGAETIKNMNDDIDLELSVSVLTKTLKDVQLERDALWVKTQEDEREINQLRDAVDQWKKLKKDWEETAHKYSENVSYWRSKHEVLVKVIVENTPIPKVLIPILREFPEIVQSAITPVSKEEIICKEN